MMALTRAIAVLALAASVVPAQQAGGKQSPFVAPKQTPEDELRFVRDGPDFEGKDLEGRMWNKDSFRGHITVVYVWQVRCLECLEETPVLQQFYRRGQLTNRVRVLTVSADRDPEFVRRWMKENGYTFPVIVDEKLAYRLLEGEQFAPWIVNAEGRRSAPFRTWTFGRVLMEAEREERRK